MHTKSPSQPLEIPLSWGLKKNSKKPREAGLGLLCDWQLPVIGYFLACVVEGDGVHLMGFATNINNRSRSRPQDDSMRLDSDPLKRDLTETKLLKKTTVKWCASTKVIGVSLTDFRFPSGSIPRNTRREMIAGSRPANRHGRIKAIRDKLHLSRRL